MECNLFSSYYHNYSITKNGLVYQKYNSEILKPFIRNGFNEVLFSLGTYEKRYTQWFRVDWLVAHTFLSNPKGYNFIKHKDGNNLNDDLQNLEWTEFCCDEPSKFIEGYNKKYIITNTGKVYNNYTGQEMKQRSIKGYPCVALRFFDGNISTQKIYKVHRLVAEYFIPKIEGKELVNHIDGVKSNNNVTNLEWVNHSENTVHAVKHKLIKSFWNKELAIVAINLIEQYDFNYKDVAKLFCITRQNVGYLYQRGYKTWGLNTLNKTIKKHSNKKDIPEHYKEYITKLLKANTVLN
jgi:hypothetical protein